MSISEMAPSAPTLNSRRLMVATVLLGVAGVAGMAGAALGMSALSDAFRQWVTSERTLERWARAKAAANAGAATWMQGPSQEVRLPDAGGRIPQRAPAGTS